MINRNLILIAIFIFLLSYSWAGEINSVIYDEGSLKIQLTEKDNYKIIPQDDPFKLIIELEKTKPGILSKKMLIHEGIVSEVSAKSNDKGGSIIDILFAEPVKTSINFKENLLVVNLSSDKANAKKTEASKIIDLSVNETEDGLEINIYGDSELSEPFVTKYEKNIELAFENVKFNAEIPKNIPIDVRTEGNLLVLNLLLDKDYDVESFYLGDEVIIDLRKAKPKEVKLTTSSEASVKLESQNTSPSEIKKINIDFQDADVVGVLRLIGDVSGYNMVIHPEVKGKITLKLSNVPWTQALDIVCKTFYLGNVFEGNIIRVAPLKVFQEEKKLQAETKDLFKKAEDTDTKIISLRYASPDKVKATVEGAKLLSPQGNIVIDERTRALIVKDIPSYLKEIEKFVMNLDKPIKQILLETRILEISSNYSKSLGFEWGINWSPPGSRTTIVGSQSGVLTVPGGSTPIAVNLPASSGATGTGTSAFTIGYLNAAGTFALDLRITALQESGKGKIISNPKVITLDNQKAKIVQGESIPYGEKDVQSGQISTKFKDVAITVETTPNLIDDRSLQLDINVIKEDLVEFINIGGTYAPRTTKLQGVTRVTLKDGETLVIGGIYKKKDTIRDSKVPLLGDIPIAGELFKSTGRDETLYEVLIFITPRILSYE